VLFLIVNQDAAVYGAADFPLFSLTTAADRLAAAMMGVNPIIRFEWSWPLVIRNVSILSRKRNLGDLGLTSFKASRHDRGRYFRGAIFSRARLALEALTYDDDRRDGRRSPKI
jgi:hypothetical protein